MITFFNLIFKVLIPPEIFQTERRSDLQKAKFIIIIATFTFIGCLSAFTTKSLENQKTPILEILGILYCILIPLILKKTSSLQKAGAIVPLGFVTLGFYYILTNQGLFNPLIYLIAFLPFYSLYLTNKKYALVFSFIALIEITVLIFLNQFFDFYSLNTGIQLVILNVFCLYSIFAISMSLGITHINNEELYEKRLSISAERLKKANESKDAFWAKVSHEIKTPLNGILGMTNLLITGNINKEQKDLLSIIKDSGENLNLILSDVIDYSKLESGEIQVIKKPFSLEEALEDLLLIFQGTADDKGIHLSYLLDGDVPKAILSDEARVKQILFNLVNNALKFTDHGYVKILVEKGSRRNKIRFTVEDTGMGIPKNKQDKIFKPFTQVDDSLSRRYGGSGLGLIICRYLAELLGGEISFESQTSKGSSFSFEVQYIPVQIKKFIKDKNPKNDSRFLSKIQNTRLLVVEDNPINQKLLVTLINKNGLKTDVANNGKEALELYHKYSYDLIFMDIQMPVMDGIQASKEILSLETSEKPKIIAVTANTLQEDRDKCLEAGMVDFITKPINNMTLINALERFSNHTQLFAEKTSSESKEEENSLENLLNHVFKHFSIKDLLDNYSNDVLVIDTIIKQFHKNYSETLDNMKLAIDARDSSQLEFHTHTLKGILSSFYCTEIIKFVIELEEHAKKDDLSKAEVLYDIIIENIEELVSELAQVIKVIDEELSETTSMAE
tara:strand:- start:27901 stop:30087 length:2187 start_codon:yes stop_codon:yes gene_type:complete